MSEAGASTAAVPGATAAARARTGPFGHPAGQGAGLRAHLLEHQGQRRCGAPGGRGRPRTPGVAAARTRAATSTTSAGVR